MRIGVGTAARLGLTGDVLSWTAPVAGALAAVALLQAARTRRSEALVYAAVLVGASNLVVGLFVGERPAWLELCLPGAVLVATQLAALASRDDAIWSRPFHRVSVALAALMAAYSWLPIGALLVTTLLGGDPRYLLPAGLMATGFALGALLDPNHASRALWAACSVVWASLSVAQLTAGRWSTIAAVLWVVTAACGLFGWRRTEWRHVAVAVAMLAGATTALAFSVSTSGLTITLGILGVAFAGVATVSPRWDLADSASFAALGTALLVATNGHQDVLASAVLVALGLLLVLHGITRRDVTLVLIGSAVAAWGLVSLSVASGEAQWTIDLAGRHHVTPQDLAVLLVATTASALGALAHRRWPNLHSWVTQGPALGLAGGHLLVTLASTGEPWRGLAALVLGAVAVAVGGWRRLAAPLVLGTGLIAGALILMAGNDLTLVPMWAWLLVAGIGLLVLAVLLERKAPRPADVSRRIVDIVWR
jgi:hypothetical protein